MKSEAVCWHAPSGLILSFVVRPLDHADADNQRDGGDNGAGKYKIVLQGEQKWSMSMTVTIRTQLNP